MLCWVRSLRYDNLTGDVLISSGIIAYLGCFLAKYRIESVDSWISLMRENKVPSSSSFLLRSVIGEDVATSLQIERPVDTHGVTADHHR